MEPIKFGAQLREFKGKTDQKGNPSVDIKLEGVSIDAIAFDEAKRLLGKSILVTIESRQAKLPGV